MSENIPSINNTRGKIILFIIIYATKKGRKFSYLRKKKPANVHVMLNNTISK